MKKDLPKVYGLNVEHDTNSKMSYTKSDEEQVRSDDKKSDTYEKTVSQKIKEIFNSMNYIYKIDAVIVTKEGPITKRLVGRNKDYLITMDNEQILISDIIDIYTK